ncbi:aminoglycoside phosphotransferase family protein [Nigerium massiliense]|uniref:aminoglycoside phosphotransferase family protein n=1 Tax=Nigerium massiliense TaxID=1522317 RepID=UPI0006939B1E|nr:aminoglycoside phosphotransferase family protein [Nigerium massiliense]
MSDVMPPLRSHLMTLEPRWREWVDTLPALRDRAADTWDLEVGPFLSQSVGSAVLSVTRRGRPAALKLFTPDEHFTRQVGTMEAARGRGYAHVYESDVDHGAVLMELLGRSADEEWRVNYGNVPAELLLDSLAIEPMLHARTQTLIEAWTLPLDVAPEVDEKTHRAAQLAEQIEYWYRDTSIELDAVVKRALLFAEQRLQARNPDRQVVCHGDPHSGNLLAVTSPRPGAPAGYVWVDPDGFRCEPDFDLGVAVRESNRLVLSSEDPVVMLRAWCAQLAGETGTDAEAIWQWGFLERVANGLYLCHRGMPEQGEQFLKAADWLISRRSFG